MNRNVLWELKKSSKGFFLTLKSPQRSDDWFRERKFRLNSSRYLSFTGNDYGGREGLQKDVEITCGIRPSDPVNEDMQRGIDHEDPIRQRHLEVNLPTGTRFFEPSSCLGLTVYDFPLIDGQLFSQRYGSMLNNPFHPCWFFASSPDGIFLLPDGTELCAEIKCPKHLYEEIEKGRLLKNFSRHKWLTTRLPYLLSTQQKNLATLYRRPGNELALPHKFIKPAHYCQMMGQQAITGIHTNHYVVGFTHPEFGITHEEVKFDQEFWQRFLFPSLVQTLEEEIFPRMNLEVQQHFYRSNSLTIARIREFERNYGISCEKLVPFDFSG